MIVLGIETSCDDTSLALYDDEKHDVVAEFTAAQLVHELYGGVVPEIASRAHIRTILPVFDAVLARAGMEARGLGGIGVTNGPGLVGSLLVGAGFAKALSFGLGVPIVGIHHIEAHILANELGSEALMCPCVVLVVSGGHTCLYEVERVGRYTILGSTRDDAAGEAFDKIAKLLGLGYPGGPAIEKAAQGGNPAAIPFPRAMMNKGDHDFSFSGLKTAVRLYVDKRRPLGAGEIGDIAASAQEAIVDALARKALACALASGARRIYCAGGVAANRSLRGRMHASCEENALDFHAPPAAYCTDNGAMVACAASKHLARGRNDGVSLDVFARGELKSWLS